MFLLKIKDPSTALFDGRGLKHTRLVCARAQTAHDLDK